MTIDVALVEVDRGESWLLEKKTEWFENEREGGEAGAGGLADPVLISIRPPLIKSP